MCVSLTLYSYGVIYLLVAAIQISARVAKSEGNQIRQYS